MKIKQDGTGKLELDKKENIKLVKYLEDKFNKYRNILNLNNWQIKIGQKRSDLANTNSMTTNISKCGYTNVTVDWDEGVIEMWRAQDWQCLDRLILHELAHVLVNDLSTYAHDRYATEGELQHREERLCDDISVIIHRLLCDT